MEKKSKPARFKTEACGTHTLPCDEEPATRLFNSRYTGVLFGFSVARKLPVLVWSDDLRTAILRHAKAVRGKQGMRLCMDQSFRL